ncbi:conserved hypothetical protein [Rhodococcus phage E3]|uniref:hypothetical protein n=1 Tax=Rhodococcus phage E3 TaxID=1007869 RepID=UPI0002C6E1EC|nr:hypothetical protein M176_gp171 [Rhodococcus phage E3]AEQ21079.1 conserved hypothetical protein [Rhodococcus phage E3]
MTDREIASAEARAELENQVDEVVVAHRRYVFTPEPRCRVCQHEDVREKVNRLLAHGRTYASILREIEPIVEGFDDVRRPTYQSIYNHAKRHFAIDNAARAVHREILERRAVQTDIDFVNGVAHAITPLALLESTVVKGYQAITSPDVQVDVKTAIAAAVKLHELTSTDEKAAEAAQIMAQLNQVIQAVRKVVPEQYWDQIVDELEGKVEGVVREVPPLEVEVVADQEPDDPAYEPDAVGIDQDDDLD